MCGPSQNRKQEAAAAQQTAILQQQQDQAAAQLAQQQQAATDRSNKITANDASINDAFSQYGDDYFGKAAQNVRDYYTPQLQSQYTDAQRKVALGLADEGLSDSSVAARKAGDLKSLFDTQLQGIESKAQDAATSAKNDVATRKSNLLGLSEAGNSLDNFNDVLTPQIQSISLPTSYSDLGQVFGSLTGDLSTLQKTGLVPTYQNNSGLSAGNSTNSARVIN